MDEKDKEKDMSCISVDTVVDALSGKLIDIISEKTKKFLDENPDVTLRVNKKTDHGVVESLQGKAILVGPKDKLKSYYTELLKDIFVEWENEKEES